MITREIERVVWFESPSRKHETVRRSHGEKRRYGGHSLGSSRSLVERVTICIRSLSRKPTSAARWPSRSRPAPPSQLATSARTASATDRVAGTVRGSRAPAPRLRPSVRRRTGRRLQQTSWRESAEERRRAAELQSERHGMHRAGGQHSATPPRCRQGDTSAGLPITTTSQAARRRTSLATNEPVVSR
jgi:hypothetical protein